MPKAPRIRLQNGTELRCLDAFEAAFLEKEMGQYFEGGITLKPGATVLDVGANIGMFSAEVSHRLQGNVQLFAFEPMPPVFEALQENAGLLAGDIEALPYGLGAKDETLEFTYFPLMSCLSSAHRGQTDMKAERARVAASLVEVIRSGMVQPKMAKWPLPMLEGFAQSYVATRMKGQKHPAKIRTLSGFIDERSLTCIDLLKVDVEGAEEAVLQGIEDEHWPRIQQIVVELEHFEQRLDSVGGDLQDRGFTVKTLQEEAQAAGDYGLVFGVRAAPE